MTANLSREMLSVASAEAAALHVLLKQRCPDRAFLAASELLAHLKHGGASQICRRLLDQMLEASGDAVDRAGWHLAVWRIEQALSLEHHPVSAAADAAVKKGPDHWRAYIDDLRATRPAAAEGA